MSCPTYTNPSRTRRTVVELAVEQTPGCLRTKGFEQILLYENFNPLQAEFDTIKLNRARNGLAPEGTAIGLGTYRLSGSIYMFGSGIPNVSPAWAKVLRACGWKETRYVMDTAPTVGLNDVTAVGTVTGGNMAAGTYKYKFSIVPATASNGETKLAAMSQTPGTGAAADGGIVATGVIGSVTLDWSACAALKAAGVVVRIYRTKVGGSTFYYLTEVDGDVAPYQYVDTWIDDNLAELEPTEDVAKEYIEWVPANQNHDSLSILSFLDSRKYPASGVRGTMTFAGDAAQPFKGDFNLQGVYNDSTEVANDTPLSTPGFPPRLLDIGMTITKVGGAAYTPVVKNIGLNLGANVTARLDANADSGVIEYGIFEEFAPRFTCQIEVDGAKDWIGHFKDGDKFLIDYLVSPSGVGSTAGTRFSIKVGDDPNGGTAYGAQLITAPQFDDSNGIRVFNLEFEPSEVDSAQTTGKFIYFKQY